MPRTHRALSLRAPLLALAAAAIAATALGCDVVFGPEPSPRPSRLVSTPTPTLPPEPEESDEFQTLPPDGTDAGISLVAATDALADLRSYQVTVATRGIAPAASPGGAVRMTSTLIQGNDPSARFTMTGAAGFSGGRLEAVVIGDKAWFKEGSTGWKKSAGGAADFDAAFTTLSPRELVDEFEGLSSALTRVGLERRNGQRAVRFHAEGSDPAAAAVGLSSGSIDLWRSATGDRLVALAIDGLWDAGDGLPFHVVLRIDVSHVNDAANRVTAPE